MGRWPGSWTIAHWKGVPIRIHVSVVFGLLWFSRLTFAPGLWTGFLLLVLAHELGHAALVFANRATPTEVVLHGFGGECSWSGRVSPLGRAVIASGGVVAQGIVYVIATSFVKSHPPENLFAWQVASVFAGRTNLYMIAFNLIPMPPLDGAEVWKMFPLLAERLRPSRAERKALRDATLGAENAEELRRADAMEKQASKRRVKSADVPDGPVPPEVEKLVDSILDDAKKH